MEKLIKIFKKATSKGHPRFEHVIFDMGKVKATNGVLMVEYNYPIDYPVAIDPHKKPSLGYLITNGEILYRGVMLNLPDYEKVKPKSLEFHKKIETKKPYKVSILKFKDSFFYSENIDTILSIAKNLGLKELNLNIGEIYNSPETMAIFTGENGFHAICMPFMNDSRMPDLEI